MLGVFYRAPKPGAPPFVEVGAKVEPGTVIGIIEVMKLMNSIHAGDRGRSRRDSRAPTGPWSNSTRTCAACQAKLK